MRRRCATFLSARFDDIMKEAIEIIDDIITDISDNYFYARSQCGVRLSSNGAQLTYLITIHFLRNAILSHCEP